MGHNHSLAERHPHPPYEELAPGTVMLSDRLGEHIVLSPQPSSDPNDPLVCT